MDICHKLKKIPALFVLFLFATGFGNGKLSKAQSNEIPRWAITGLLQANLPQIPHFRDVYFPNTNGALGFYAAYRIEPKFDIKIGLKANVVAYSRNATDNAEIFTQRIREYYIDLPINLYYYPSRTERTWGIYAGLTPSLLLNKYVNQKEHNPKFNNLPSDPSQVGRFDLGVNMGASLKLSPRWFISGNFTYSLTSKQNEAYNAGRFSQFSIGLGYQINSPNPKESEKELSIKEPVIPFGRKSTVLFVRLKTESKKINYYRNSGLNEVADDLQEKVNTENETTRQAFIQAFTFCSVYFFYDTSSAAILELKYNQNLLNEDGEFVQQSFGDSIDILIAEFASPYSDAFGSESGFGLVVYDGNFNQMKAPFPYFISTFYGLVSRKEVVARFDRKLRDYGKYGQ
ncbi:MAG: outer membrane beta-barrel protein [Bacteroidetes bacterium]|nr:outer membrane beta-barrel protein [Bacteroidota bacterium]